MKTYHEIKAELECSSISLTMLQRKKTKDKGQQIESNEEGKKKKIEIFMKPLLKKCNIFNLKRGLEGFVNRAL